MEEPNTLLGFEGHKMCVMSSELYFDKLWKLSKNDYPYIFISFSVHCASLGTG